MVTSAVAFSRKDAQEFLQRFFDRLLYGPNDAPALRQAQIGIAVSTATDVAKSAAGVVLTKAGLSGIVAAVKEGRTTFQRILTYTLNSIVKKIVQVLLLAVGFVMTGHAVMTPLLMVLVMVTGDFLAMSLTTDAVKASEHPNPWNIGKITIAGVYAIRDRRHLWGRPPGRWLVASSIADLLIISVLATRGIMMTPLPIKLVGSELAAAAVFWLLLNGLKTPVFARLEIS